MTASVVAKPLLTPLFFTFLSFMDPCAGLQRITEHSVPFIWATSGGGFPGRAVATYLARTHGPEMGSKGKPGKKAPHTCAKGFGPPPPPPKTFEEVCAEFKSRLPRDEAEPCVCGSGDSYSNCCKPFHQGEKIPETPESCLRSRYSAFAYRIPAYIISTTDKSNSEWQADKVKWARRIDREQMFDSFQFVGLEVGELEETSETEKYLSLRVTLQPVDQKTGMQTQPEPMVFLERSKFLRSSKGAWLYSAGEVTSQAVGFKGRTLKDEKDLDAMRKDVEYAKGIIGSAAAGKSNDETL
mmetsp:Transcript_55761/g.121431  ORF Transcript_55761/g.121431 Transcript_55761/m.121431 type:complete len:297 (-) Transcript_55761:89-979(-)